MLIFHVFLLLFAFPLVCLAQSNDQKLELDPIVISATRSDFSLIHTANSMSILTAQEISQLPAHNLAEALSYMPGVSIQPSGFFGQSSSVSMRGAYSRQVLVMVDGIPFNTQLSGQANLSSIPLENVERIEIIRGGDSSAWGSNLGGIINVISKSTGVGKKPEVKLSTSFAQYAQSKNALEVSGGLDKFGFYSSGSFLHADGNLAQSRTQEAKSFTKLSYDLNESSSLNSSFGLSSSQLRYGPTNTSLIYDQPYISRYAQAGFHLDRDDSHWRLAYKYNDQDITTDIYSSSTLNNLSSIVSHDLYQGTSIVGSHQIGPDHVLTTGSDFDWHTIKSNIYLKQSKSINMQAPFINDVWTIGHLDLQPGLRFDRNSQFGTQLSPSVGAIYHMPELYDASLRLKAARVFNAPPLLWLYNTNTSFLVIPNPDLKAERANNYETSLEFKPIDPLKLSVEGYYSDVKDGIAVIFDGANFQSRNFRKFRRTGGQTRLDYQLNHHWNLYTSAEFNDVINIQTKSLVRDANIARESFKWGTNYHFDFGLGINLQGYYNRSLASPSQANDRKPIFDFKLTQDFKQIFHSTDLQLFLSLHNLTNSQYWVDPTFPYPGRYVEGGFSLTF